MDLPIKVVSYQEEARECLQLAEAESQGELRTILMGMARGVARARQSHERLARDFRLSMPKPDRGGAWP
jgi:hypothetical protein